MAEPIPVPRPHVYRTVDRRLQYGVRDDLATPEQLRSRDKGSYDPRPASGTMVAKRVRILCAECEQLLSEVVDFERRYLVHSVQSGRWVRVGFEAKCKTCYAPGDHVIVDADEIMAKLERARREGKVLVARVGRRVSAATAADAIRKHHERHPEAYESLDEEAAAFWAWWKKKSGAPDST